MLGHGLIVRVEEDDVLPGPATSVTPLGRAAEQGLDIDVPGADFRGQLRVHRGEGSVGSQRLARRPEWGDDAEDYRCCEAVQRQDTDNLPDRIHAQLMRVGA